MTSVSEDRPLGARKRNWLLDRSEEFWLCLLLVALVALFAGLLGPRFVSIPVFQSMMFQMPELGIFALAMMITLLSGGINLSIISTGVLGGILAALILTRLLPPEAAGDPGIIVILLAILVGLTASTGIGVLNGLLIAKVGVSPILATLGTLTTIQGVNLLLTGGRSISGMPATLRLLADATMLGIPVPLILFATVAIVVSLILNRTSLGVAIYMIGSNEPATRYAGVNTSNVVIKIYALSGLLAGIAGILMLARFNSINASFGSSYLLVTILAAVLGGTNPFGGFGRVRGIVLALIVLQVVSSGLNMLHLSAHVTLAIWGGLLIAVMAIRALRARRIL